MLDRWDDPHRTHRAAFR